MLLQYDILYFPGLLPRFISLCPFKIKTAKRIVSIFCVSTHIPEKKLYLIEIEKCCHVKMSIFTNFENKTKLS